jgi:hypothetical protein
MVDPVTGQQCPESGRELETDQFARTAAFLRLDPHPRMMNSPMNRNEAPDIDIGALRK